MVHVSCDVFSGPGDNVAVIVVEFEVGEFATTEMIPVEFDIFH
jgi:hypothetical protein